MVIVSEAQATQICSHRPFAGCAEKMNLLLLHSMCNTDVVGAKMCALILSTMNLAGLHMRAATKIYRNGQNILQLHVTDTQFVFPDGDIFPLCS